MPNSFAKNKAGRINRDYAIKMAKRERPSDLQAEQELYRILLRDFRAA